MAVTPVVTRSKSKDNMKQSKLTADPNGSIIVINDSEPDLEMVQTSKTAQSTPTTTRKQRTKRSESQSSVQLLESTPGRAHRCPPKALFPTPKPKNSESIEQIAKSILDNIVNNIEIAEQTVDPTPATPHDTSRDLEQILADALADSPPATPAAATPAAAAPNPVSDDNTNDEAGTDDPLTLLNFYKARTAQLQRDLIADQVKFNKMSDHAKSLEAAVSLLNDDNHEKAQEIKRLQAAVDKGRLNVSQATGIRHHLDAKKQSATPPNNLPKGTTGGKKSTPQNATEDALKSIQAELAANRAQINELQKQVSSAFDETDDQAGYTTVRSRKWKRRNPPPPPHQPTPQFQQPPPPPPPPSYSDATAGRAPKPTILSVGSSLSRGTGRVLRNHGTRVIEYNFPGADLPELREKIVPILEKNPQITKVILWAGGNDCEKEGVPLELIKAEYDALIDTIKLHQGWDCKVIISSVPQRRRATTETRHKIAGLNLEHYYHSDPDNFVYFVDAAPKLGCYFYDRVHPNYLGLEYWARKVTGLLSTFHPTASTSSM